MRQGGHDSNGELPGTGMYYLDETLASVAENLALDEALLVQAEAGAGGEVLRVWEWPSPAVVLGSGCRLAEEVDEQACSADGVPVLRRSSGGGTVLLGPGCLLYTLVLSYERSAERTEVRSSYRHILGRIEEGLGGSAAGVAQEGISDLAVWGRKVSGTAQQRKRSYLLHHGTLLYAFDLGLVKRYLRPPPRQPEYRAGRDHEAFMANLPLPAAVLKQRLRQAWGAEQEGLKWSADLVRQLVAEKYGSEAWTRRR
jgi:lipoate-protein ligase A